MDKRFFYGVRISGCSGEETGLARDRATADRVRRVVREYKARGGWTGWRTLDALADLAAQMKGARTAAILAAFDARPRGE